MLFAHSRRSSSYFIVNVLRPFIYFRYSFKRISTRLVLAYNSLYCVVLILADRRYNNSSDYLYTHEKEKKKELLEKEHADIRFVNPIMVDDFLLTSLIARRWVCPQSK